MVEKLTTARQKIIEKHVQDMGENVAPPSPAPHGVEKTLEEVGKYISCDVQIAPFGSTSQKSLGLNVSHGTLYIYMVLMKLLVNGKEPCTCVMVTLVMPKHHGTVPDWNP